jgi:hypothetical protein
VTVTIGLVASAVLAWAACVVALVSARPRVALALAALTVVSILACEAMVRL